MKEVSDICRKKNIKLHLDGARLFNALAETNDEPVEVGKNFDTISICLSKGLGAPVGSLLLGDKISIKNARRIRKVFGGGMRQAGIIAAAGLYALKNNVTRLKEDHKKAKQLEDLLKKADYIESVLPVYTNIIIFNLKKEVMSGGDFEKKLGERNIKVSSFGKDTIRMVTHLDYTDEMHARTMEVLRNLK
jgi:threonine aldolase